MAKESPESIAQFVRLLTDHQAVIRGYIRSIVPNAEDTRDVLQNTNIILWERRKDFTLGTNFKAWSFTVARFRALEHIRKNQKNSPLVFDNELLDVLVTEEQESIRPEQHDLQLNALSSCLQQLKPKDQALIQARYLDRTPLADYAEQIGSKANTLSVALHRLRVTLRKCINKRINLEA